MLKYNDGLKNKIEESFNTYTESFDAEDERIQLKINHTYRVADNCLKLAFYRNLDEHDTAIAFTLGMLHDVGRFVQVTKYKSFLDNNSDHAEDGADLLFTERKIDEFIPEGFGLEKDDENYIEKAIRLHNKYLMPDDLTQKELLYCNIIRDADKIDIFRTCALQSFEISHEFTEETVSASHPTAVVKEAFRDRHTVDFKKRETPADIYLSHVALCFGLTYPESRRILDEQGYIWQMMEFEFDSPDTQREYEQMKEEVRLFLQNK